MKYGLIIRGQYPAGDDMRIRHKEDLEAAKRAEQLGYDLVAKGSQRTVADGAQVFAKARCAAQVHGHR